MLANRCRALLACSVLGIAALSLGGCAGHDSEEVDDGLEVTDATGTTASALATPDPSTDAKSECNEHDRDGHHHHRKHKFKVLDRLDGVKDHQITIAALPAGLPERLIARLHEMDADGNGAVTKDEARAWRHAHKHDR